MIGKVLLRRTNVSEGRSRRTKSHSDKKLARRLKERISGESGLSKPRGLSFYVREGAVTIYGSVVAPEDRAFVAQLVSRTPGVTKVYDHVAINREDRVD